MDPSTCTVTDPQRLAPNTLLSGVDTPSAVAMLCDRGELTHPAMESVGPHQMGNGGSYPGDPAGLGGNPSMRHLETANFLFADGHVKSLNRGKYEAAKPGILNSGIIN